MAIKNKKQQQFMNAKTLEKSIWGNSLTHHFLKCADLTMTFRNPKGIYIVDIIEYWICTKVDFLKVFAIVFIAKYVTDFDEHFVLWYICFGTKFFTARIFNSSSNIIQEEASYPFSYNIFFFFGGGGSPSAFSARVICSEC